MTVPDGTSTGTFASATVTVLPSQLEDLGLGQAKQGSFLSDGHSQVSRSCQEHPLCG